MLLSLKIRDLAVVESLDLDLRVGLTVLTGETGAGKSILLTALGLALGDRADSGYIRPGCKRAEINLEFDVDDTPPARQWLEVNELDQAHECMIRRVLSQDGRSKAYINDRPVTLQALQALSALLVEIHGQHAHLRLLQAQEQRRLLDESADNKALLGKVNALHREWVSARKKLDDLVQSSEQLKAREDLLRYQIDELEQLEIASLDYPALVEEHTRLANLEKILSTGQAQWEQIYDHEHYSINALLGQSIHALAEITPLAPEFHEIGELLNEAEIQIQEAGQLLRRRLEALEADPARLEWLERQLGILHSLARKHHVEPEGLAQHLAVLRQELHSIEHCSEEVDALSKRLAQISGEYKLLASELSARRAQCAAELQTQITGLIHELGMPQGQFCIEIRPSADEAPKAEGWDQIEFLVTTNPGLPPRPLAKVASGGELSRISLAIQVAAIHSKTTPTMIFDEVDAGIGGGVAEMVGQRLRALGQDRQVLCVTHLPQVAVQAHHHLLVQKVNAQHSTQSRVKPLAASERKHEIARMLGGIQITSQTLAHAEEMLQLTQAR